MWLSLFLCCYSSSRGDDDDLSGYGYGYGYGGSCCGCDEPNVYDCRDGVAMPDSDVSCAVHDGRYDFCGLHESRDARGAGGGETARGYRYHVNAIRDACCVCASSRASERA